jgi:D-alanyl-D-alanine carboxypeptidase
MRKRSSLYHVKSVALTQDSLYISSILVLFFLSTVIVLSEPLKKISIPITRVVTTEKKSTSSPFNKNVFQDVTVNAKAYLVYDVVGKEVIASSHMDDKLPLASITKVMTSLTALSLRDDKDEIFKIEPSSIEDGYDLGLSKNQTWKLEELLKYMLIFSSNDAAVTIAAHYGGKETFVKTMNSLAVSYGLTATFSDPAGRDMGTNIGGVGTVLDAAKLFILVKTSAPDILDATTKKRQSVFPLSGKLTGIPNTNQNIESLPGAEGSKTGYTDLAGGNLGVIVDITIGRPVVIVVLGSTREGRFKDVDVLYKALEKSLESVSVKEGE